LTKLHFRLIQKFNIKRVFDDECHQPLTDRIYRPQWAAIQSLIVDNSWQIIHLTATLPPVLQSAWETLLGIDKKRTIFLRGPTNRLELSYNVLHVNPKERHPDSVAGHLIRMLEDDNQHPEGRRIMFVSSIVECDRLASLFECFKHHGGMNQDDRHNHLEGWKKGLVVASDGSQRRETWIVATPGLITGYDYHRVEDVIFYEIGYGLLNLVQGGGRGGRSGQHANVILLTSDRVYTCHQGLSVEEDVEMLQLMFEWAHNTEDCRRLLISEAMDGCRVTCKDLPGAQQCDICEPDSKITRMLQRAMEMGEKPMGATMPMDDIQMLVALQRKSEVGRPYEDDMDDMDFAEDELIANLDLASISSSTPNATPSVSMVTISTPNTTKATPTARTEPPREKPEGRMMSAQEIASIEDVGMNVKVAGSTNMEMQRQKQRKTEVVNELGMALRGHCAICWTWKGKFVKIGEGIKHKPVADCGKEEFCDGKLPWGGGPKFFATKIDFKKWHFCWHCGFPQDVNHVPYRPSCHPVPGPRPCIYAGIPTEILFTLHQDVELWKKVKGTFGLGDELDDIGRFIAWCGGYRENTSNYWMGLEVVIWYWTEKSNGRI